MDTEALKAYKVPLHTLWLQRSDVIEIRITAGRPGATNRTIREPVVIQLDQGSRLLGVTMADTKTIKLGRWLRQNWDEFSIAPDEPIPPSTVTYDEAGQVAYFSVWPNLGEASDIQEVRRRAEVVLAEAEGLIKIRIPVKVRRRPEDALSAAAGYLPTR
jgi:hypothetical protein